MKAISNALDLVPSTALHILRVLVQEELVNVDAGSKRYSLGSGMLSLARSVIERSDFPSLVQPVLDRVARPGGGHRPPGRGAARPGPAAPGVPGGGAGAGARRRRGPHGGAGAVAPANAVSPACGRGQPLSRPGQCHRPAGCGLLRRQLGAAGKEVQRRALGQAREPAGLEERSRARAARGLQRGPRHLYQRRHPGGGAPARCGRQDQLPPAAGLSDQLNQAVVLQLVADLREEAQALAPLLSPLRGGGRVNRP